MNDSDNISLNSAEDKPADSRRLLIILLAAVAAIGPLATDMYLPAMPEIVAAFGSTPSMVQLTITTWLLGMAFGQVIAGPLSDIYGRRTPLITGLGVLALTMAGCVAAPNIYTLIALRLAGGFAASSALVVSRAIASDIYRGTMLTKFLATVMIIQGIAPIIAPVLGGQLLRFSPWEGIFALLTVVTAAVLLMAVCKYEESLPAEKRLKGDFKHVLKVFGGLCARPYFASLCAIQFFVFTSLFAYISGMPFVLQGIYGFTPQEFSFVFAIVGIGMMIMGKITGTLTGRISDMKLMYGGLIQGTVFGILFLIGLLLDLNVYVLIAFLLLSEISLANIAATSFSLAMRAQKKVAGSASALLGFFSMISGGLIAPVVGIGGGTTALPTGIAIAASEILALCIYLFITKKYAPADTKGGR